jgi:hypothetical protein
MNGRNTNQMGGSANHMGGLANHMGRSSNQIGSADLGSMGGSTNHMGDAGNMLRGGGMHNSFGGGLGSNPQAASGSDKANQDRQNQLLLQV